MVIEKYKKGKELSALEKIKKGIIQVLGSNQYDYTFKYEVSYHIVLQIKPNFRNKNNMKIFNDFKDIQDYLTTNNISYGLIWWSNLKEIAIELNKWK